MAMQPPDRCVRCGGPLRFDGPHEEAGTCPVCDAEEVLLSSGLLGPTEPTLARPAAAFHRRIGESGIELVAFVVMDVLEVLLSPVTLSVSGVLPALLGAVYFGVRDLDGGRLSIGKRLTGLAAVDEASGAPVTPQQALVRNSPYIAAWLVAALPDPFGFLGWIMLLLWLAVDLALVVGHPTRRRLGDVLAGTAVIERPDRRG